MSAATATATEPEEKESGGYLRRFVQGDLASMRVVLGLAVIWAIFYSQDSAFLSAANLTNLMLQITAVGLISIGIVYVLLLGEIDLSVGAVSGLCAAIMGVLNVKHGWNPYLAIGAGVLAGATIGMLQGMFFSGFGVPSFVVTLAGLLTWQGALLYVLGDTGTLNINDGKITGLAGTLYDDATGIGIARAGHPGLRGRLVVGVPGKGQGRVGRPGAGARAGPHRRAGRGGRGGHLDLQQGPRAAAGRADPDRLRGGHAVRGLAHAVRPARVRRGRQRRGGAAGGHQREPRPRDRVLDRRRHGRDRRHPGGVAAAGRQPVLGRVATCCCWRSPGR